jgi:hypothetical protein
VRRLYVSRTLRSPADHHVVSVRALYSQRNNSRLPLDTFVRRRAPTLPLYAIIEPVSARTGAAAAARSQQCRCCSSLPAVDDAGRSNREARAGPVRRLRAGFHVLYCSVTTATLR